MKDKNRLNWLDDCIRKQKPNAEIIESVCDPYTAAELQEFIETGAIEI